MDTLHEDRYTFFIISRSLLLRMRNVSDKSCTKDQNTHFIFNNFFFGPRKSCSLWDEVDKCGTAVQATDRNVIQPMRIACWIPKATQYVIITAFPPQQWLRERSWMLRQMDTARLVKFILYVVNVFWQYFLSRHLNNSSSQGLLLND